MIFIDAIVVKVRGSVALFAMSWFGVLSSGPHYGGTDGLLPQSRERHLMTS